jgi:hypothetical protein
MDVAEIDDRAAARLQPGRCVAAHEERRLQVAVDQFGPGLLVGFGERRAEKARGIVHDGV